MPLKSSPRIVSTHAFSVVGHPNQEKPSVPHVDRDGPTPRIDAVLEELFYDRRRAFDHLPRCDATDDVLRKDTDLAGTIGPQHDTILLMRDGTMTGRDVALRRRSSDLGQLILRQF
jgi:hypothetical protein